MTHTPADTVRNNNSLPLRSGGSIPLLGFGTWQLKGEDAYEAVRHALEIGYRHIDTATSYGNEEEIGRAVRDSGLPREDVFVTTKLPPSEAGNEQRTLDDSLRRLGLDHVDLWLVHWPPDGAATPATWERFLDAQQQGRAAAVGVSNYSSAQIDELVEATGRAPEVNQIKWCPALHDEARLDHLRGHGVVPEGYSPLQASDLADPVLAQVALAHGVSVAQVILRWHLDQEIVAIPRSRSKEHIESNFDIFRLALTEHEFDAINSLAGQPA